MPPRRHTISVSIACPPTVVYSFLAYRQHRLACEPASPVGERSGRGAGDMVLAFRTDEQAVTSQPNWLRVVAKSDGAELICTLFASQDSSPDGFTTDATAIEREMLSIKRLLEVDEDHAEYATPLPAMRAS